MIAAKEDTSDSETKVTGYLVHTCTYVCMYVRRCSTFSVVWICLTYRTCDSGSSAIVHVMCLSTVCAFYRKGNKMSPFRESDGEFVPVYLCVYMCVCVCVCVYVCVCVCVCVCTHMYILSCDISSMYQTINACGT